MAFSRGTPERRVAALSHATDALIAGRHTDDEIRTLGEVIGLLTSEVAGKYAKRFAKAAGPAKK